MAQLPSHIVVAIVQLIITTLQLLLMTFTWFSRKRTQSFINQRLEAAETVITAQLGGEMSPADIASSAVQSGPFSQRPRPTHDTIPHGSSPDVGSSRARHQVFQREDDYQLEHCATSYQEIATVELGTLTI
ncbi:hypothetical protein F4859DRAFT_174110 [Xylaria cf. heliscus]|nr:hypothetical protein F4859DRAFT_174110 [Xylaria cf. heliscus]